MTETKRFHFVSDMEAVDPGWRCKRCGVVLDDTSEVHRHRKGLLTECVRARIVSRLGRREV